MHNWKQFADRFRAAGYGIDDLKDVQLRFYPITTVAQHGNQSQLKAELKAIEDRLTAWLNPACNYQYKADQPSATRYPPQRTPNTP
jgi:hypothetical protein